jgi:hypothetical protein
MHTTSIITALVRVTSVYARCRTFTSERLHRPFRDTDSKPDPSSLHLADRMASSIFGRNDLKKLRPPVKKITIAIIDCLTMTENEMSHSTPTTTDSKRPSRPVNGYDDCLWTLQLN